MRAPFGYIELTHLTETESRIVRIAPIDLDFVTDQLLRGIEDHTRIRTNDGFCQSSYSVKESPSQVLNKVFDHDEYFLHSVMAFNQRNFD